MPVATARRESTARIEASNAVTAPSPPGMHPGRPRARQSGSTAGWIVRPALTIAVMLLIGFGWSLSAREVFTAKEGVGYWLGISGGLLLLAQLAYPLRKRVRFMRQFGSAPLWFRSHMLLGMAGPLLILYHSSFSPGATNSNVALGAMLLVAGSGIVGRYFYGKIHNGLFGAHSNLQDVLQEATTLLSTVETDIGGSNGSVAARLTEFGVAVLKGRPSLASNFGRVVWLTFAVPPFRYRILSAVRAVIGENAARLRWDSRDRRSHYKAAKLHIRNYLAAVVKASELSFYERLFAMWHILHLPFFFLLILTGVTHVVAVHLY